MTDKDNQNITDQLVEELLSRKKINNNFEVMKIIIYIQPSSFYSISSDDFTKEEYNELKELAEFLQI